MFDLVIFFKSLEKNPQERPLSWRLCRKVILRCQPKNLVFEIYCNYEILRFAQNDNRVVLGDCYKVNPAPRAKARGFLWKEFFNAPFIPALKSWGFMGCGVNI
jgi:hypothetical protein